MEFNNVNTFVVATNKKYHLALREFSHKQLGKEKVEKEVLEIRCRAPLLKECPQHHEHKGDPGVTPGTCGAIGERAQVILVWVRAPRRWERLPPTKIRSHKGQA